MAQKQNLLANKLNEAWTARDPAAVLCWEHPFTMQELIDLPESDTKRDMLRWLCNTSQLLQIHAIRQLMFMANCHKGDLAKLQMAHDNGVFTREFVCERRCLCVKLACVTGHLEIVEWLVNTFRLDEDDVFDRRYPLNVVRARGHVALANWLVDKFGDR